MLASWVFLLFKSKPGKLDEILYGWSKTENRPDFKLVTGISTGTLIESFVFLGPAYDDTLKEIYTTVDTKQIIDKLNIFSVLTTGESFARSTPLENRITQYIDDGSYAQLSILRNRQIQPSHLQINRNLQDISSRASDTMIKAAALSNLFRMYLLSQLEQSGETFTRY